MIEQLLKDNWPLACGPLNWQFSPDGLSVYSTGHIISINEETKESLDSIRCQVNVYSNTYILPSVRPLIRATLQQINCIYKIVDVTFNETKRQHEFIVDIQKII